MEQFHGVLDGKLVVLVRENIVNHGAYTLIIKSLHKYITIIHYMQISFKNKTININNFHNEH